MANNRTSNHLRRLGDINELIDKELEGQKNKRIQIYNLEVDIQKSINIVR